MKVKHHVYQFIGYGLLLCLVSLICKAGSLPKPITVGGTGKGGYENVCKTNENGDKWEYLYDEPWCTIETFTLEEDWKGPVFFYYRLVNFYQNHKDYVKSRSD